MVCLYTVGKRVCGAWLCGLVVQRRRWLNGSFFSLIYFVAKFHNLLGRSDHSFFRKMALVVQFFYQASALILSWFGVGSLYLSLVVIFQLALDGINYVHEDHVMWAFALFYSYLVVYQVGSVCRAMLPLRSLS